ncbi:MAG: SpoIIE family protein phosphatase [Bacterioplanes sp.]|nr:SpoIIE family protein phosphatase [Bacterioplanes sp.]
MDEIRILIADDHPVDRKLLSRIITNQGHRVDEAENGEQAIALFQQFQPDLVLLDVMMPVMDGRLAAKAIKEMAGHEFVPIIFLTSLTDAHSLAECLEFGDDFLTKPYNPIILQAKIRSFSRMRDMHRALQQQRDVIELHRQQLLDEQRVAKTVFDNVAHDGCLSADNIRYVLSPLAIFNGDLLLAAHKPTGGMYVLLGDFTGHGLPAAIGSMPVAEIFYGMTAKGFSLRDILREINLKLHDILPLGFFCCAALAELSFERQSLDIWMGGLPDGYLLHADGRPADVIKARHLPLGVLNNDQFKDDIQQWRMQPNDRLLLLSDGVLEARNEQGELFGYDRLSTIVADTSAIDDVFEALQGALAQFVGHSQPNDDVTILDVHMWPEQQETHWQLQLPSGPVAGPLDWQMNYRIGADSLRHFNPLPLMIHIMMEVPGLRVMGGQLHTVMSELYANAFEHGVLGMDSSLKATRHGFIEFYREREQRIQSLQQGYILIELSHQGDGRSGELTLTIEDSGCGFDAVTFFRERAKYPDHQAYSGRGIALVEQLCEEIRFSSIGNRVEAVVRWPRKLQENPNDDG